MRQACRPKASVIHPIRRTRIPLRSAGAIGAGGRARTAARQRLPGGAPVAADPHARCRDLQRIWRRFSFGSPPDLRGAAPPGAFTAIRRCSRNCTCQHPGTGFRRHSRQSRPVGRLCRQPQPHLRALGEDQPAQPHRARRRHPQLMGRGADGVSGQPGQLRCAHRWGSFPTRCIRTDAQPAAANAGADRAISRSSLRAPDRCLDIGVTLETLYRHRDGRRLEAGRPGAAMISLGRRCARVILLPTLLLGGAMPPADGRPRHGVAK